MPDRLSAEPRRLRIESYPLVLDIRALYSDVDSQQHINGGAISRYFEEGRAAMNTRVFGRDILLKPDGAHQLLFASVFIEYLAQGVYPGSFRVGTAVSRVGRTSFVQSAGLFQEDRCVALCDTVTVFAKHGQAVALSDAHRNQLETTLLAGTVVENAAP